MAQYILETFDWDTFSKGVGGKSSELAMAVASRLVVLRRQSPELLTELLLGGENLVEQLTQLLARDEWYADLDVVQRNAMDRIVALIFDNPARKLLAVRHVGSVDSLLGDYARGFYKIVGSGQQARYQQAEVIEYNPKSELQAFGCRPFRFHDWDPRVEWETNPFTDPKPVHTPEYSIHSPSQVVTLLEEVARVDVGIVPVPEYRREFESGFLVPLEEAVNRNRALYAWQCS